MRKLQSLVTKQAQFALVLLLAFSAFVPLLHTQTVFAFSGEGDGTELTPYLIYTCEELQEMNDDKDAYYALGDHVDCSDTINWNGSEGFVPIGDNASPFLGELDGRGFAVDGIFMDRASADRQGVFGKIGASDNQVGLVKDIYFGNLLITGDAFTGGVVGQLYGQLNRVHAEGEVYGSTEVGGLVGSHGGTFDTIINSRSDVDVTGTDLGIGGIAGYNDNDSEITNSYATGDVTGIGIDATRVGGLVGHNLGDIESSHATGNVTSEGSRAGGLAGRNGGSIFRSYATGSVNSEDEDAGGLVGFNSGDITQSYSDNDNNPESDYGVIGTCNAGGLVGLNSNGIIHDSFSRSSVTTTLACSVGGLVGLSDGSTTSYAYATGHVSGAIDNSGGFGGSVDAADLVRFSFFDTQTTQQEDACGSFSSYDCTVADRVASKTTALMKDVDTYTTELGEDSWDFADTWDIDEGINDGYPYFIINGAEELDLNPENQSGGYGSLILNTDNDFINSIRIGELEDEEICSDFGPGEFTVNESELETQDPSYSYPTGFAGFSLTGCDVGGTATMHLTFAGDFDIDTVVLRKHNSVTGEFATITPTYIAETTVNDHPAIELFYEITDGGALDEDGEANGVIVDPIGLGVPAGASNISTSSGQNTTTGSLADTGQSSTLVFLLAGILLTAGSYIALRQIRAS